MEIGLKASEISFLSSLSDHSPLRHVAQMMKPTYGACDEEIPHKRAIGTLVLLFVLIGGPYVIFQTACALWPLKWTLLALLGAAEWLFYVCYYRSTYEDFNKIPALCQPKDFTPAEGIRTWGRFIKLMRKAEGITFEEYIRPWFLNAPMSDIKQGNVAEMLAYGFFYRKRSEMTGDLAHLPDQMVRQLEQVFNIKFAPGYTPGLAFMSHLWEDLRAHYRPLVMYLFMEVLGKATRLIMTSYGFKTKRMGLLTYYTLNCGVDWPHENSSHGNNIPSATPQHDEDDEWTPFAAPPKREASESSRNPLNDTLPDSNSSRATPVMFLHGVGGLVLYLEMLKHVIGLGHPVIVIEYKHVAMRLCSYIPTVDEVTDMVVRILENENIQQVCVVGHSYGSFMASRLNALHRDKVHSLCLVDPVCLGMFMPHLLHNFMYRRPRIDWRHPDILVRDLALWFASRDVHLAATFARRFYWTDINMWPDDLGPGSCIVLSGNDDLCNAEGARKMLVAEGQAKVIINPALFHGAILLDNSSKAALLVEVKALLDTSGSLVVRLAKPVVDRTLSAARSIILEVGDLTTRLSHNPGDGVRQLRRTFTELPARTWTPLVKKMTGGGADRQPDSPPGRVYLRSRSSIHSNFIHSLASLRDKIPGGIASAPTSPQPQQQQQQPWQDPSMAAATGRQQDPQQPHSAVSGHGSWESLQEEADEYVAAADGSDIPLQESPTSPRHKRPLSTIPSISEERSAAPSNRTSASGNEGEGEHDVDRLTDDRDQDPAAAAGAAAAGSSRTAAGHDWVQWEGGERALDQQYPSAPEPTAAAAGGHVSRFSDALRNSKASQLVRRAFTSWNSRDRRHWQHQQQQQQQMSGEHQQHHQDVDAKQLVQEEALQLQRMLQQQQRM